MDLETIELPRIHIDKRVIRRIDFWLLTAVVALYALSLPLIDSATQSSQNHYFLKKQAVLLVGAFLALGLGAFTDYHDLVRLGSWVYGANLVLLVAVFFIGKNVMGSTRWIPLGFFDLQPSETAKIGMILFYAKLLSDKDDPPATAWEVISYYFWAGIPVLLILKQPDLGTAAVIVVVATGILYFAGTSGKLILKIGAVALSAVVIVFLLHFYAGLPLPLQEYQVDRIVSLFNPHKDPLNTGYQVLQSKIAIGSGNLFGKGIGKGTQNRLDFIPEQHTDFIFSVVGEEFGFVGSTLVLVLYAVIMYRTLLAASSSPDKEGTLLAGGVLTLLLFHVMVNVGMTMGIMPVTGVPLPFLSYGGSSLVINSFGIGIVLNVGWNREKLLF